MSIHLIQSSRWRSIWLIRITLKGVDVLWEHIVSGSIRLLHYSLLPRLQWYATVPIPAPMSRLRLTGISSAPISPSHRTPPVTHVRICNTVVRELIWLQYTQAYWASAGHRRSVKGRLLFVFRTLYDRRGI